MKAHPTVITEGYKRIEKYVSRISHNYFAFISGVIISLAIELLVSIFSGDEIPVRWLSLLLASVAISISSLYWSIIAWTLDSLQNLAFRDAPDFMGTEAIDQIWDELIQTKLTRLRKYFLVAIATLLLGLSFLIVGFITNNKPPSIGIEQTLGNYDASGQTFFSPLEANK